MNKAKWEENVEEAKKLVMTKSNNQMQIAALALEVCEISWGGAQQRDKFTLSKFAEEIKLDVKTLSNWVAVRVSVYDKLPPSAAKNISFTKLMRIGTQVTRDAPRDLVHKKHDEIVNIDAFSSKMQRYLSDTRSLQYNFAKMNAALKCDQKTLEEILFYCLSVVRAIKKDRPEIKPKNNSYAAKFHHSKRLSAANALGIERTHKGEKIVTTFNDNGHTVKVTNKDRDIIQFIQKKDKFFSPTEIGMKLKGHNRSSASAWAHRTLNKFIGTGLVERNSKGHYKWVG